MKNKIIDRIELFVLATLIIGLVIVVACSGCSVGRQTHLSGSVVLQSNAADTAHNFTEYHNNVIAGLMKRRAELRESCLERIKAGAGADVVARTFVQLDEIDADIITAHEAYAVAMRTVEIQFTVAKGMQQVAVAQLDLEEASAEFLDTALTAYAEYQSTRKTEPQQQEAEQWQTMFSNSPFANYFSQWQKLRKPLKQKPLPPNP